MGLMVYSSILPSKCKAGDRAAAQARNSRFLMSS